MERLNTSIIKIYYEEIDPSVFLPKFSIVSNYHFAKTIFKSKKIPKNNQQNQQIPYFVPTIHNIANNDCSHLEVSENNRT